MAVRGVVRGVALALVSAGIGAAPAAAASPPWRADPSASAGAPGGLNGIACPSARNCVAVGYNSGRGSLSERWDGVGWSRVPVPTPAGHDSSLYSVNCPSGRACWAVGAAFRAEDGITPLVERWNGRRWRIVKVASPPSRAADEPLVAVSCTSARSCLAVGNGDGPPYAERWNGRAWRNDPLPSRLATDSVVLTSLACRPGRCLAVGTIDDPSGYPLPLTVVRDRRGWRRVTAPELAGADGRSLSDVACVTATDCTTVGFSGGNPLFGPIDDSQPLLARRGAGGWTAEPSAGTPVPSWLFSVACRSGGACLAAGGSVVDDADRPLIERRTGDRWTSERVSLPAGDADPSAVACPPRGACQTVGASTDDHGNDHPLVLRRGAAGTLGTPPAPVPQGQRQVAVLSTRLRVDRTGTVRPRIRCLRSRGACTGRLVVVTRPGVWSWPARYWVAAGRTGRVPTGLRRGQLAVVRARGGLTVRISALHGDREVGAGTAALRPDLAHAAAASAVLRLKTRR